jgi:hypothetical protein
MRSVGLSENPSYWLITQRNGACCPPGLTRRNAQLLKPVDVLGVRRSPVSHSSDELADGLPPVCQECAKTGQTTSRRAVDAAAHLGLMTWTYRPQGNRTRPSGRFAAPLHTSGRRFDTVRAHQVSAGQSLLLLYWVRFKNPRCAKSFRSDANRSRPRCLRWQVKPHGGARFASAACAAVGTRHHDAAPTKRPPPRRVAANLRSPTVFSSPDISWAARPTCPVAWAWRVGRGRWQCRGRCAGDQSRGGLG